MTDEELSKLEALTEKAWTLTQLALEPNSLPASKALEAVSEVRSALPALVEEVRRLRRQLEACAEIAATYGPSRPPTHPAREHQHKYEGECAASSNIARLIRERLK